MSLRLLDQIAAENSPPLRDDALVAMAAAVGHERADVAERALDLVRSHTTDGLTEQVRSALEDQLEITPPTTRAALVAALGHGVEPPRSEPAATLDTTEPQGPLNPLDESRRLEPLDDLDELVLVLSAALEGRASADDVERALAAMLRSGGQRPANFDDLVSPLVARCEPIIARDFRWVDIGPLARIVMAWAGHDPGRGPTAPSYVRPELSPEIVEQLDRRPWPAPNGEDPYSFWLGRSDEIVIALQAGAPVEARAEPTHMGGFIHPDEAADRVRRTDGIGPFDRDLAALRRHDPASAYTPTGWRVVPDRWGPGLRVDADLPDEVDPLVAGLHAYITSPDADRMAWHDMGPMSRYATEEMLALVPNSPQLPAAIAADVLSCRLGAIPPQIDVDSIILHLIDPTIALDGVCVPLVALALTGEVTSTRVAAVDLAIAGFGTRRLDPEAVGDALVRFHDEGMLVLTRLSQPLTEVASASAWHRRCTQIVLLTLVAAIGDAKPRGIHGPLDTLARLAVGGIDVTTDQAFALEQLANGSSKAARSAKAVLEHSG